MNADWQSFAAPAAVLVTLGVFVWRWLRRGASGSCAGCACAPKTPKPVPASDRKP